jgi:hypothetical protein
MLEVSREIAEAYGDVARHICHVPENEPIIIFAVRGLRTPDCGRKCEGCPRYLECFPETHKYDKEQWFRLINMLVTKG